MPVVSRRWCTTCACCCAWKPAERASPRRRSWTHESCKSSPQSGARVGYDGHKWRKGSKAHAAVDTLGQLSVLAVTPANQDERTQVAALAEQIQAVTGDHAELTWVDQGYTGEEVAQTAAAHGIQLEVVKLPEAVGAKPGFVLLPRRWVVNAASPGWLATVASPAIMSGCPPS